MDYQNSFVDLLKRNASDKLRLVDIIAESLSISKDSAYRRMRNETPFTIDETIKLCIEFQINPTELIQGESARVYFNHNRLYANHEGFLAYLTKITYVMEQVAKVDGHITYAAEDVPMFLHLQHPTLAAFKLFYWSKAVLNSEMYHDKQFSLDLIHPDITEQAKKTLDAYNKCRSTEIWTDHSIISTIRQIMYYVDSYQFKDKKTALQVIDELKDVIDKLEVKCETGCKDPENGIQNLKFYDSEVMIGNNTITITGLPENLVFLSHNTFNTINTSNPYFFDETKIWTDNLIQKSTLISQASEKHRFKFFNKIRNSIAQARGKIELADI